jgi:hypothetical protein
MLLTSVLLALTLSGAAPGAPVTPPAPLVRALDPQSVVDALQTAGYMAKLGVDGTGDPMVTSASSGTKFYIYFYGCSGHKACATIEFHSGYHLDKPAALDKINDWNWNHRFGRAYLDKDKDPVLEMDLDLDVGGMTQALFADNLDTWATVMGAYERLIGWRSE